MLKHALMPIIFSALATTQSMKAEEKAIDKPEHPVFALSAVQSNAEEKPSEKPEHPISALPAVQSNAEEKPLRSQSVPPMEGPYAFLHVILKLAGSAMIKDTPL